MKWIRFTLDTHTDAVDMLSYMLDEIGVEGIEIEDHVPLSEEDKKKMFVDILPDPEENDGTAKVHFYMEPENCDSEKVMLQVQNILGNKGILRNWQGHYLSVRNGGQGLDQQLEDIFQTLPGRGQYCHQANLGDI